MSPNERLEVVDLNLIREQLAQVQRFLHDQGGLLENDTEMTSRGMTRPESPQATASEPSVQEFQPAVTNDASVALVAQPLQVPYLHAFIPPGSANPGERPLNRALWPSPLAGEALHGLAGEVVGTIEPHTESDPAAILGQLLVTFGNVVGRSPHYVVEGDRHHPNLFANFVGASAKARKGTSLGRVLSVFEAAAEEIAVEGVWHQDSIMSGLSSGEGLIWAIRDDDETDGQNRGARDKRILVVETEFSRALVAMAREGNILSEVIRQGWDTGNLRIMNKNEPAKATGAHISIIGHITCDDLRKRLSATEQGNGFANRFLWFAVKRSKVLPEGGNLTREALAPLADRLRQAIAFSASVQEMRRDDSARRLWSEFYPELSEGKPGLLGSVTSRAEAQVLRVSMIYALLDCSAVIRVEHLRAAVALWGFCEASARYIFGDALGDPVADTILAALRSTRTAGLNRTQIRDLFGRHAREDKIAKALASLESLGLARRQTLATGGRPAESWFATGLAAT